MEWFEKEDFWINYAPIMFDDNRWAEAPAVAEYVKEINRLRAQLRYMKKSVTYCGGQGIYENQKDIIKQEKEIKRLCKLRDYAKAMEKTSGLKKKS